MHHDKTPQENPEPQAVTHLQARSALFDLISERCGDELSSWLSERVTQTQAELSSGAALAERNATLATELGQLLLEARKRSTKRHLIIAFAERERVSLSTPLGQVSVGRWRRDEAVGVWVTAELLARCCDVEDSFQALYEVYDAADTEGRVACLKAINFLSGVVEDGMRIIHDAGRTYLNQLMEAGWCDHPFASEHLSDEEYRKALLKSLFCDVPVQGFLGLERRADAELSRSLCEYANEREAAGRVVPSSVLRVASYYPQPGLVARLIGRLEHPSAEERLTAAIGLERARDLRAITFVRERFDIEEDPEVRAALAQSITALEQPTQDRSGERS